jgi:hypothetical protein
MPYLWMQTLMKAQGITPSPLWLAPEVYAGETFTQAADIWYAFDLQLCPQLLLTIATYNAFLMRSGRWG